MTQKSIDEMDAEQALLLEPVAREIKVLTDDELVLAHEYLTYLEKQAGTKTLD